MQIFVFFLTPSLITHFLWDNQQCLRICILKCLERSGVCFLKSQKWKWRKCAPECVCSLRPNERYMGLHHHHQESISPTEKVVRGRNGVGRRRRRSSQRKSMSAGRRLHLESAKSPHAPDTSNSGCGKAEWRSKCDVIHVAADATYNWIRWQKCFNYFAFIRWIKYPNSSQDLCK